HPVDHRRELSRKGQLTDAHQLVVRPAVAADDRLLAPEEIADVRGTDGPRRGPAGDEAAALAERADRAFPRRLPHRLADDVDAALGRQLPRGDVRLGVARLADQLGGPEARRTL